MASNLKIPIIPLNFIKRTIQNSKEKKDFKESLTDFSKKNSFDLDYTIYIFIKESLRLNIFFNIQEDIRNDLLFEAIIFGSLNEPKLKIKPKNHKDIKEGKKDAFFTQLQKELIKFLYRNMDINSFNFDITLDYYLNLFFELSSYKKGKI